MGEDKDFTYTEQTTEYVIHLRRRNRKKLLWLLLLLLPLLLLIKCSKDVHIETVDIFEKKLLPDTYVEMTYLDKQLFNFKKSEFFSSDTIIVRGSTDENGLIVFEDISYTLYSRIIFAGTRANILATNDCYMVDSLMPTFHSLKNEKKLTAELANRTYEYEFFVTDMDDEQPIPNADVTASGKSYDKENNWNGKTDPAGLIPLQDFPYCGEVTVIARCYGYENDTIKGDARLLYGDIDPKRKLELVPVKKMIKFVVRDLNTNEPIPNATANLVIDGKVVQTVKTNVNGYASVVGEGEFASVHIIKEITIEAQKPFYNDTSVTTIADNFIKLDDDKRVLYLRATLQDVEFRDTDGASGLAGVTNTITVNGVARPTPEYSNANGKFMVAGVLATDKVSIAATKTGYIPNNTTISNKLFGDLVTANSKRDIPLAIRKAEPDPPTPPVVVVDDDDETEDEVPDEIPDAPVVPCDAPQESGGEGVTIKVHSVGKATSFVIKWDMYSVPDQLIIYCGTGASKKQLYNTKKPVSGTGQATLKCSSNYITIKVIGSDNTQWQYQMECK